MNTRLLEILADSFPKILIPGLTVTIPLTAISFSLAMVIAVAMALVQFARVPVLTQLCRFYIWVFRGTPLPLTSSARMYNTNRAISMTCSTIPVWLASWIMAWVTLLG